MRGTGGAVERIARLSEIAAGDWDRIAGDNVHLSHGWLSAVESEPDRTAEYLLVRSGGRLRAALPLYYPVATVVPGGLQNPARIFAGEDGGSSGTRDWAPLVLGGAPIGYDNGLPVEAGLGAVERDRAVRDLLDGMCCAAPNRVLLYLREDGAGQVASAGGDSWGLVFTNAAAVIPVRWPSFDGYVDSLPSSQRSAIRREVRRYGDRYQGVGRESLADCVTEMAPLSAAVHAKYGDRGRVDRQRRFYSAVAASMAGKTVVFTCRQNGCLVGYCLGIEHHKTLYLRSVGLDYAATGQNFEYFSLVFYEPIRYALERRLDRLHLGIESIDTKLRRGAVLEPLWSAVSRAAGIDQRRMVAISRCRLAEWDELVGARLAISPSRAWRSPESGRQL